MVIIQNERTMVGSILKINISQNPICDNLVGFPKSGHSYTLPIQQLLNGQLAERPAFQVVFYWGSQYNQHSYRVGGWGRSGSHKVVDKGQVFIKSSQMASTVVICTSTCHTKQLYPRPNPPASRVTIYSQLDDCSMEMEPFKDHSSTRGCLTGLRNN